jgi:hypothetical protein
MNLIILISTKPLKVVFIQFNLNINGKFIKY